MTYNNKNMSLEFDFNEQEDGVIEIYTNKYGTIGTIYKDEKSNRYVFKDGNNLKFYKAYVLAQILKKLNELNKNISLEEQLCQK